MVHRILYPQYLTSLNYCDKLLPNQLIQRGGGTGPVKPRQPQHFSAGANSGRSMAKSILEDEA